MRKVCAFAVFSEGNCARPRKVNDTGPAQQGKLWWWGQGLLIPGGGGEGIPSFRVEMRGYNFDELEKANCRLAEKAVLKHKHIQEVRYQWAHGHTMEQKTEENMVLSLDQNRSLWEKNPTPIRRWYNSHAAIWANLKGPFRGCDFGSISRKTDSKDLQFDLEQKGIDRWEWSEFF